MIQCICWDKYLNSTVFSSLYQCIKLRPIAEFSQSHAALHHTVQIIRFCWRWKSLIMKRDNMKSRNKWKICDGDAASAYWIFNSRVFMQARNTRDTNLATILLNIFWRWDMSYDFHLIHSIGITPSNNIEIGKVVIVEFYSTMAGYGNEHWDISKTGVSYWYFSYIFSILGL